MCGNVFVSASKTSPGPAYTSQVVAFCVCVRACGDTLTRAGVEAPSAERFLAHLCDPIMTRKLDTGEDIPLPSSKGRTLLPVIPGSNRVW